MADTKKDSFVADSFVPDGDGKPAVPSRSLRDELKGEGFLDSAWKSTKGMVSGVVDGLAAMRSPSFGPSGFDPGGLAAGADASRKIDDAAGNYRRSGDRSLPREERDNARDAAISAVPFGSTYIKAREGNIGGALGDVAPMVVTGGAARAARVPAIRNTTGRLYQGATGGSRELVYNLPLVGKTVKATIKGAREGYAKSDPNYVDPKVAAAAERDAQALVRTRERVRAGAEERARIKAEKEAADALLPQEPKAQEPKAPEPFRPNSSMRAKMPSANSGSAAGMPSGGTAPRAVTPAYGPDVALSPKTAPPAEVAPAPVAPPPFKPNPNILRKTRFTPSGGTPGMPSARPVSVKPRSGPALYGSKAEVAPTVEPTVPPAAQPTPPAATASSGPSAPEGSTVIPPKPGVKYDAHDIATMDKINASRVANDAKVSAYLKQEGVTKTQWAKATPEVKRQWAKSAGSKSRYDNPERIQHLADLLDDAPSGPSLYQGKQQ